MNSKSLILLGLLFAAEILIFSAVAVDVDASKDEQSVNVAKETDDAYSTAQGGGGGSGSYCRYGCCYYGSYGCQSCCRDAKEATLFVNQPNPQKQESNPVSEEKYGGWGGGWGGGGHGGWGGGGHGGWGGGGHGGWGGGGHGCCGKEEKGSTDEVKP